ncbi:MAG: hypothetical protein DRQ64_00710, partial [Gammaproteobacteria bacterium]
FGRGRYWLEKPLLVKDGGCSLFEERGRSRSQARNVFHKLMMGSFEKITQIKILLNKAVVTIDQTSMNCGDNSHSFELCYRLQAVMRLYTAGYGGS